MDDSEDLEALFDSIVQAGQPQAETPKPETKPEVKPAQPGESGDDSEVFMQIGHMTRNLYDALHSLGLDKSIEKVAASVPDANDRLAYIANLTQQAAERVLNATEIAKPIQDQLAARAQNLSGEWQKLFDNQLSVDEFKALAAKTRDYLNEVPNQIRATNAQLTEIMMAQDFQDLTGQVIKKVVEIVRSVEAQLVTLLIEHSPAAEGGAAQNGLLNGPVIKADGRVDVVTNQGQVDELLESLGF